MNGILLEAFITKEEANPRGNIKYSQTQLQKHCIVPVLLRQKATWADQSGAGTIWQCLGVGRESVECPPVVQDPLQEGNPHQRG